MSTVVHFQGTSQKYQLHSYNFVCHGGSREACVDHAMLGTVIVSANSRSRMAMVHSVAMGDAVETPGE